MYQLGSRDRCIELTDFPQMNTGVPAPVFVSSEDRLVLSYHLLDFDQCALVFFLDYASTLAGVPNDEALRGHVLASRGLKHYAVCEVLNSGWIRELEQQNSVHPKHRPNHFEGFRHLIFSFHDSTFEIVCREYRMQIVNDPPSAVFSQMHRFVCDSQ